MEQWASSLNFTELSTRIAGRDGESWFVAAHGSSILGYGTLGNSVVENLYVDPKSQKLGVGAKLLGHLERRALLLGFKKIELQSSLVAQEFYEQRGWKCVKRITMEGPIVPIDVLRMEKIIRQTN